jgi:hypothetical protein
MRCGAISESLWLTMDCRMATLKIGHCTFEQFAALVQDLCKQAIPDSVEGRLYRGLLAELKARMV